MKPKVWLLSLNVHMLNGGEAMSVTKAAIIPRDDCYHLGNVFARPFAVCYRNVADAATAYAEVGYVVYHVDGSVVQPEQSDACRANPYGDKFRAYYGAYYRQGLHASKHAHGS